MALPKNIFDLTNLGNIFILLDKKLVTSTELQSRVKKLSEHLYDQGIRPGHKILISLNNTLEFCEYLLAGWEAGACIVPVSPLSTPKEMEHFKSVLGPQLIIDQDWKKLYDNGNSSDENLYLILHTSGSSGKPKGVVLSREAIANKIQSYQNHLDVSAMENTLCMLPLNFGHGLISNFLFPLFSGKNVFLAESGNMDVYSHLGEIIDEHKITCFSSVPSILKIAANFSEPPALGTLKRIYCASASLDKDTWQAVKEWSSGVQVRNMYGLTELSSWIAGDLTSSEFQENTFDLPWDSEIKIVKSSDQDEFGEIYIKSLSMMDGYYKNKDATEAVIKDGWFSTGDVGFVSGKRVHLKGRIDNVINLSGIKIYPQEIDQQLKKLTGVSECYSFGLKLKETESDYAIGCVIVPTPGASLTIEEVKDFCKIHLSSYKIPSQIKFIDKLPLSPRGKIDQLKVKKMFSQSGRVS